MASEASKNVFNIGLLVRFLDTIRKLHHLTIEQLFIIWKPDLSIVQSVTV